MEDTPMVNLYKKGRLKFMTQEQYINLICKAITLLPQNMVIHRLTGDAPRDILIGPMWSLNKWEILNAIDNCLKDNHWYQGLYFSTN